MKKSILTKLSAFVAVFVMSAIAWVTCLNVPSLALADESNDLFVGEDIVVTRNATRPEYLTNLSTEVGAKVSFRKGDNTVTYAKEVTLGEGENSLIDFAPLPSEKEYNSYTGDSATAPATSNLEEMTIKVESVTNSNDYFEIKFGTNIYHDPSTKDDWTKAGTLGIRAAANGQKLGGHEKSSLEHIRQNGTCAEFSFFHGKETDRIGFNYNTTTTVVSHTGVVSGGYNAAIRQFNKAYDTSSGKSGAVVDTKTWAGFAPGTKVKISVTIGAITSGSTDIMFYSVGGKALADDIYAVSKYDVVAGTSVLVPDPDFFVGGFSTAGKQAGATYKIESIGTGVDGADEVLTAGTEGWVAFDTTSAPVYTDLITEAGEYRFSYKVPGVDTAYETSIVITAVSQADADARPLVASVTKTSYKNDIRIPGYTLALGAQGNSGMDKGEYNTVEIYYAVFKNGSSTPFATGMLEEGVGSFTPDTEGTYAVSYAATDAAGRVFEFDLDEPIVVSYADHRFVDGNEAITVPFGSESAYFNPSYADIEFYDARFTVAPVVKCSVRVQKPSMNAPVEFNSSFEFDELGEYLVCYDLEYTYGSDTITKFLERPMRVVDVTAPTLVATRLPQNTTLDVEKTTTDSVIYLRAKRNAEIILPEVRAFDTVGLVEDLNSELRYMEAAPGGQIVDKSLAYNANKTGYKVKPTINGQYVFKFSVLDKQPDGAGMQASLIYMVDVREKWLSIDVNSVPVAVQNSSDGVIIPDYTVVDYDGNKVDGAVVATTLVRNGVAVYDDVAGKTIIDIVPGEYELVYKLSEGAGMTFVRKYNIVVKDTNKPKLEVAGVKTKGETGKAIPIATFSALDNDVIKGSEIVVTFGDETVNVFDGAFTPTKPGKYVITITSEDLAGNVGVYTYIVNVTGDEIVIGEESGLPTWALVLIIVGGVIVLAGIVFAVLFILNKKGIVKIGFMDKLFAKKVKTEEPAEETAEEEEVVIEDATDEENK